MGVLFREMSVIQAHEVNRAGSERQGEGNSGFGVEMINYERLCSQTPD